MFFNGKVTEVKHFISCLLKSHRITIPLTVPASFSYKFTPTNLSKQWCAWNYSFFLIILSSLSFLLPSHSFFLIILSSCPLPLLVISYVWYSPFVMLSSSFILSILSFFLRYHFYFLIIFLSNHSYHSFLLIILSSLFFPTNHSFSLIILSSLSSQSSLISTI